MKCEDRSVQQTEDYRGAQLVSNESFLRRLPIAFDLEGRFRTDAIVIACDILGQAYQDLFHLGVRTGSDVGSLGHAGRASAIGLCWLIVDQLHAVRQLVRPPAQQAIGPIMQRFLDMSAPATDLRNKMDHLNTNLRNLGSKKGIRSPLFGAISYVLSNENPETGGLLVTISSGTLQGGEVFPAVNPAGRNYTTPVGLLQLYAFDIIFEFSPALAALQDFVQHNERRFEEKVQAAAAEEALKGEHTIEELMAHFGSVPAIVMDFEFGASEPVVPPKDS